MRGRVELDGGGGEGVGPLQIDERTGTGKHRLAQAGMASKRTAGLDTSARPRTKTAGLANKQAWWPGKI